MPSTFSPNLRVELIGSGEQAGTWGTTTNRNLGTLLEGSIAGRSAVSVTSAAQAFTALDGVDDQARKAIISLTTTTTADFAVYAPPASKLYVIQNASAYTATVYNSTVIGNTTAAGTGVAIPAGKTIAVVSDGVNFTAQTSHLPALTLGTDLAVVDGGTGASNAADARSNLGAAPLASPTFTGVPVAPTAAYGTSTTQLATTAFVQAALQALYPVGSVYINAAVATNPATLLGFGTWVTVGDGKVLVNQDTADTSFDVLGETGGSKDATVVSHTHTATTAITDPGHRHRIAGAAGGAVQILGTQSGSVAGIGPGTAGNYVDNYAGTPIIENATTGVTAATTVNSAGSSGTNANLQPYVVVRMWKRTA